MKSVNSIRKNIHVHAMAVIITAVVFYVRSAIVKGESKPSMEHIKKSE